MDELALQIRAAEKRMDSHEFRLDHLDKQHSLIAGQHTELRVDLGRMDENLKGIRDQATAHKVEQSKAMTDMQSFMERVANEQNKTLDRITGALGIDDDIHAAGNLRKNLARLAESNSAKDADMRTIRNWIISAVLGVFAFLIVIGATNFARQPLPVSIEKMP